MRKEFDAIREILLRGARQVKLTELWQGIHQQLAVGTLTYKGTISFTEDEKSLLRQWIKDCTGVDPLEREHLPAAKVETSPEVFQKATPRAVFGRMLRLARDGGGPIQIGKSTAVVPEGAILSVEPEYLNLQQEKILVVDNGKLVRDWYRIKLPEELQGALIVFRGQQRDALALLSVIDEGQPQLNVGFYDFDPEGLKLALLAEHDAILVPARWTEMLASDPFYERYNQPERFISQIDALLYLQGERSERITSLLRHMKANKIALMQEHLVSEQEPLQLIYLR